MTTFQIDNDANDGYVRGYNANYSTAHGTAAGSSTTYFWVGQAYLSANYWIAREFLKFDTSSIGADATITAAKLQIYGYTDDSTVDFIVRLQKWTGDTPIDTGDYNSFDGTNYDDGNFNTSSFVTGDWNDIIISNFALINKTGNTLICVRSSRDISESPPTAANNERLRCYDYSDNTAYASKLEVISNGAPSGQPYISRVQRVTGMRSWGGISSFCKRFPALKPLRI